MLTSSRVWAKQARTWLWNIPFKDILPPIQLLQAPPSQGCTTSQKCHLLATLASTSDFGRAFLIQSLAAMDLPTDTLLSSHSSSREPASLGSLLESPISASVHSPPVFPHMPGPGWACVLALSPPTALSTVGVWAWDPGTVVPTLTVVPDLAIFLSQLLSKPHHRPCYRTHHSPLPSLCQDLSQTLSQSLPQDLLELPSRPLSGPVSH